MKPLDLFLLNLRAPYTVWESDGLYSFKSEHGILFDIEFEQASTIVGSSAYWLGVYNRSHQKSPLDAKVQETIVSIIEEFFRQNPDILLYMCDTADNQQAVRARLFQRWFDAHGGDKSYIIRTAVVMDEGTANYVSLIVQKSNPDLETILHFFDSEIGMFQENKPS